MDFARRKAPLLLALAALAAICCATASAKPKTPPTIGQLDGTIWMAKAKGTGYYLPGGQEKIKEAIGFELTQVDPDVLRLDPDDPVSPSLYGVYYEDSGVLAMGWLEDDELATIGYCGYVVFSGKSGKWKATGELIEYDADSAGEAAVFAFKAKQIVPK